MKYFTQKFLGFALAGNLMACSGPQIPEDEAYCTIPPENPNVLEIVEAGTGKSLFTTGYTNTDMTRVEDYAFAPAYYGSDKEIIDSKGNKYVIPEGSPVGVSFNYWAGEKKCGIGDNPEVSVYYKFKPTVSASEEGERYVLVK